MKKRGIAMACALLLLALLCGCGEYATVQPTTPPDGSHLQTVANDVIRVSYPADEWLVTVSTDAISMMRVKGGLPATINLRLYDKNYGPLDGRDVQHLAQKMEEWLPGYLTVERAYTTSNPVGECIVVLETVSAFTDEYIDLMLARGAYTEKMIEEMGGRETLLAYAPVYTTMFFAEIGGAVFQCTCATGMDSVYQTITGMLWSAQRVWKVPLQCSWD